MGYFKNFSKIRAYKILEARLFACLIALTYHMKGWIQKRCQTCLLSFKTINSDKIKIMYKSKIHNLHGDFNHIIDCRLCLTIRH